MQKATYNFTHLYFPRVTRLLDEVQVRQEVNLQANMTKLQLILYYLFLCFYTNTEKHC